MEVQDTLRRAKEVLLNEGWTKGNARRTTKTGFAYCISGAISLVVEMDYADTHFIATTDKADAYMDAMSALACTLNPEVAKPRLYDSVIAFNDDHERTLDEVIELIDRAMEVSSEHTVAVSDSQERQPDDQDAQAPRSLALATTTS